MAPPLPAHPSPPSPLPSSLRDMGMDADDATRIVVLASHALLAALLGAVAASAAGIASTASGSYAVQFVAAAAAMLALLWVWASGAADECGGDGATEAKSAIHKSASAWVPAWRGARVGLGLFALWLAWGLLETGLISGGGDVDDDTDTPLSWSWLTGTVALGVSLAVGAVAYLPIVARRWPDLCRYALPPLALLLLLLPNRDLLLDPRLWDPDDAAAATTTAWGRLASALPRAVALYLLFVLSWHALARPLGGGNDPPRRRRHPLQDLRRTALAACRVLWITQTASPVVLAVGIVGSLGAVLSQTVAGTAPPASPVFPAPMGRPRRDDLETGPGPARHVRFAVAPPPAQSPGGED